MILETTSMKNCWLDGKEIQSYDKDANIWHDLPLRTIDYQDHDFSDNLKYRVKSNNDFSNIDDRFLTYAISQLDEWGQICFSDIYEYRRVGTELIIGDRVEFYINNMTVFGNIIGLHNDSAWIEDNKGTLYTMKISDVNFVSRDQTK